MRRLNAPICNSRTSDYRSLNEVKRSAQNSPGPWRHMTTKSERAAAKYGRILRYGSTISVAAFSPSVRSALCRNGAIPTYPRAPGGEPDVRVFRKDNNNAATATIAAPTWSLCRETVWTSNSKLGAPLKRNRKGKASRLLEHRGTRSVEFAFMLAAAISAHCA